MYWVSLGLYEAFLLDSLCLYPSDTSSSLELDEHDDEGLAAPTEEPAEE